MSQEGVRKQEVSECSLPLVSEVVRNIKICFEQLENKYRSRHSADRFFFIMLSVFGVIG